MAKAKKDVFNTSADYFENQGLVFAVLADKSMNVPQKAALYREAAHYFECAVHLRGGDPAFPLALKKQRRAVRLTGQPCTETGVK